MAVPDMCGIGISAVKSQAGLAVKSVEPNGPAGRSRMVFAGDLIVSCNGTPCRTFTPLQLKPLVVGPAGTEVQLELERAGRPAGPVRLVRAPADEGQQPCAPPIHIQPPHFNEQHVQSHSNFEAAAPLPPGDHMARNAARPDHSLASSGAGAMHEHRAPAAAASLQARSGQSWQQQSHAHHNQQQHLPSQPQPQPHQHGAQHPSLSTASVVREDHLAETAEAEKELTLLKIAIAEAQARQLSLKEQIAAINADIAAETKSLNAKRERATDLQQVCASLQQGHAGLKTVLAEAAQLPEESEGFEKMRARLFLVRSNGHKARQTIQMLQGDLDVMRAQAKAGVEERQRLTKEIAVLAHAQQRQQQQQSK